MGLSKSPTKSPTKWVRRQLRRWSADIGDTKHIDQNKAGPVSYLQAIAFWVGRFSCVPRFRFFLRTSVGRGSMADSQKSRSAGKRSVSVVAGDVTRGAIAVCPATHRPSSRRSRCNRCRPQQALGTDPRRRAEGVSYRPRDVGPRRQHPSTHSPDHCQLKGGIDARSTKARRSLAGDSSAPSDHADQHTPFAFPGAPPAPQDATTWRHLDNSYSDTRAGGLMCTRLRRLP